MSYFTQRAKELGLDVPDAGERKKGESYFQQRARELGLNLSPAQEPKTEKPQSNFFTKRQMELGILPNPDLPKLPSGIQAITDFQQRTAPKPAPMVPISANPVDRFNQARQPFAPKPLPQTPANVPDLIQQPTGIHYGTNYVPPLQSVGNFLRQAQEGAQEAVAYDDGQPAPTTGSKRADAVARFLGNTAAGLVNGTTEMQALGAVGRGVESLAGRVAPGLVSRLAGTAAEGAAQNVVGGAMLGQTDPKDIAINAASGAGLGVLGRGLAEGAGIAANRVSANLDNTARRLTETNPAYRSMVQEIGENGTRANVGKQALSDLDEQITSLNQRDTTTLNPTQRAAHNQELDSLQNDRTATIDYIKQYEPDFTAQPVTGNRAAEAPIVTPPERVSETSVTEPSVTQPRRTTAAKRTPAPPQQRGFVTTLQNSENVVPEVKQGLAQSPERNYRAITNQGTLNQANKRISADIDKAEAFAMRGSKSSAEQVATGIRLIQHFQQNGQIERAVTVAENISKKLTEAGQTVQAASILNRLSPEGALLYAQRKVAKINESLPESQQVKVTAKDAEDIQEAAQAIQQSGASQERSNDVLNIAAKIKRGEQITDAEKKTVTDFLKDLKSFANPPKERTPRPARAPKEMSDTRVRDRVISALDSAEQAAKERLRKRGIKISSNPLDVWADYAIVGASKLAKGAVKGSVAFGDWAKQMVDDFGDDVRPFLNKIYDRSKQVLAENSKTINQQAVSRAEKIATSYLKKNEGRISQGDADFIHNMARNVSDLSGREKLQAEMDLQEVLNRFDKAGIGRKISALQYISMLFNPVTQIKNVTGNEIMYRLERLQRMAATPVDIAISTITGKPRTITFRSGPTSWENFFKPTTDYYKGLGVGESAGWRGVNPEGLETAYDIRGLAFRSKLNPISYLERALGATMKGFDYASYNRAVNQRLREMGYLDAINNKIKGRENIQQHIDRYIANTDDNIAAIAKEYGKYVTLQDRTKLSSMFSAGQRRLNSLTGSENFGAGSLIIPFAKTPANILMRAIDYSPAGVLKAISQAYTILRRPNTDLTRADVIQSVTRALFGTGLGAVGWWLADKGVINGASSHDTDVRNLQASAGINQYQLNATALGRMLKAVVDGDLKDIDAAAKVRPGDMMWSYDWAQPTSIPLSMGANVVQELQKGKDEVKLGKKTPPNRAAQAYNVAISGLDTLYNASFLQGLQQALSAPMNQDQSYVSNFINNILKSAPGMFVPTAVSRYNQMNDNTVRENYSPDFVESVLNPSKSKIPGIAQKLPPKINTFGEVKTRPTDYFDVFLNPAQRQEFKPSKEAQFVMDLLQETGDTRLAPRTVDKQITGTDKATGQSKKVKLTGEQFSHYQQIVGQKTAELINKINPALPTETKVKRTLKALDQAGQLGRDQMKKELGLK